MPRGSRRAISPHSGDGEFIDINDISASTEGSDHGAAPHQTTNDAGSHQNTNDTDDVAIRMPSAEATRDDLRSVGTVFSHPIFTPDSSPAGLETGTAPSR